MDELAAWEFLCWDVEVHCSRNALLSVHCSRNQRLWFFGVCFFFCPARANAI